jgi:hypothetical protein
MKKLSLVLILVMLLVGAVACGGGSVTTVTSTVSPSPSVTQTVTSTVTPSSTTPTGTSSVTPSSTLSEQPDMVAYKKYFSDLGIGRMPPGENVSPLALEKNVTVYKTTDQICLYGTIVMECQLTSTMYDTVTGKVVEQGGLPKPMSGGFAGWEPMPVPAGKYEYKVYVGDALVGVFPFEVIN